MKKKDRFDKINSSKGGLNPSPTNPRPAPLKPQFPPVAFVNEGNEGVLAKKASPIHYAESREYVLKKLIKKIQEEAGVPPNASYEYDATPTAEERLKEILKMIREYQAKR